MNLFFFNKNMVGLKIRQIRKQEQMTIAQLAELTGVSESYISQLEREILDPSVSLLRKIASALQVPVTSFFDEEVEKPILTKVKDRRTYADTGIQLSWISPKDEKIEMIEFSIDSNCTCLPESFDKDVCILVTKGSVNIQMDSNEIMLNEQDSIFIVKNVTYSIHAISHALGLISAVKGNQ